MTATSLLPVRPGIHPGEDITAFLQRCADANHLSFTELTGHRRLARLWEDPEHDLLHHVSLRTGTSPDRLRQATLIGAYPGSVPARARTGRRYAHQPATCRHCDLDTVAARLHLIVLCPRCGRLLSDRLDPNPPDPPPALPAIQSDIQHVLETAATDTDAQERLRRLEVLITAAEPALWSNWPPMRPGETQQWRDHAITLLRRALAGNHIIARPPFATAALLALTWDASAHADRTHETVALCTLHSDWRRPRTTPQRDVPAIEARDELGRQIRALGIRLEHIPTIIRWPDEPIVLPDHLRSIRTATALALAWLTRDAAHQTTSMLEIAAHLGAYVPDPTFDTACYLLESPPHLQLLAAHLDHLQDRGTIDLAARRHTLRSLRTIPSPITRSLPSAAAAAPRAEQLAAGWVWLDATHGRPAGGPHPNQSALALLAFDEALGDNGHGILRDWWHQHLAEPAP